ARSIAPVEIATLLDRNTERFKKSRRSCGAHTNHAIAYRRQRASFHGSRRTRVAVVRRGKIRARCCIRDAWKRFQFFDRVLEKQTLFFDIGIRARRKSNEKWRDALGAKTRGDVL